MTNPTILRTVEVAIKVTPQELAEAFWEMTEGGQAEFFSRLAHLNPEQQAFPVQMMQVSQSKLLTSEGARVMRTIGVFGKPDGTQDEIIANCSWCNSPILDGQPVSQSYDGEVMHFGCAAQADDPND